MVKTLKFLPCFRRFALILFLLIFPFTLTAKNVEKLSKQFINKILIPEDFGVLKETHIPDPSNITELIVCVQDAHCNYEAQLNISNISNLLIRNYGFNLVCAEGSAGLIDTGPFSTFKEKKARQDFAEYFMKQGKITGPEYLSITTDLDFTIFGIEDEELYAKNYTAFMKTLQHRNKIGGYTERLREKLQELKKHLFNEELYDLDYKGVKHDLGIMEFSDFTDALSEVSEKHSIDLSQFENFILQDQVKSLEAKLDLEKLETARQEIFEKFNQHFKDQKDKLKATVHKSLAFKLKEITPLQYYDFILKTAKENNIQTDGLQLLTHYHEYLSIFESIDRIAIYGESLEVFRFIKTKLYENDLEKELDNHYRIINLIEKLFKLETLKSDYLYFKDNRQSFVFREAANFIKRNGANHDIHLGFSVNNQLVEDNIQYVIDFYEAALERDRVLLENALSRMELDKTDRFILVTGGFHSEGLSTQLKKLGKCYMVIAPRIVGIEESNQIYLEVMKNQADSVKGYRG